MAFLRDLRVAAYFLVRSQGLAITVVATLALGIGANAAIFTLVRGVMLKPLVNRDENRLIYIRQSAPGIREANTTFSVPEIEDLRARVKACLARGSARITGSTSRRQRIFVVTQIGASFLLLAGASMLISTFVSLQRTQTGMDTRRVLAINVPAMSYGKTHQQVVDFYKEVIRRVEALPGVNKTAYGMVAPWRDAGGGSRLQRGRQPKQRAHRYHQ